MDFTWMGGGTLLGFLLIVVVEFFLGGTVVV